MTETEGVRKLTIDPGLFMLPGGSKRDRRRLQERAEQAERDGLVTIVSVDPAASTARPAATRRTRPTRGRET